MRNHVGLGKLTGLAADITAAKAGRDLIEKRGVEIDLLVRRTIKRSHGALRHSAATRLCGAAVEDQNRRAVSLAVSGKDLLPLHLGAAEHLAHEAAHVVLGCAGASRRGRRLHLGLAGAGQDFRAADENARIDPERPPEEAEHHDRPDAQAAAADRDAKAAAPAAKTALAASIFDVAAFRKIVQSHGFPPP
jgi:hypothetical protein